MTEQDEKEYEIGRHALRTFKLRTDSAGKNYLSSVAMSGAHWENGVCIATCLENKNHPVPADDCSCGIYGTVTLESLMRQYYTESAQLVAVIAAEGETIIGDRGLRTAAARVVAYWVNPIKDNEALLKQARTQFVGATQFDERTAMLAAYDFPPPPPPAVAELPISFAEFCPDRLKFTTSQFTIPVKTGIYETIKLSCGETLPMVPAVTVTGDDEMVVTITWTPCAKVDCDDQDCPTHHKKSSQVDNRYKKK